MNELELRVTRPMDYREDDPPAPSPGSEGVAPNAAPGEYAQASPAAAAAPGSAYVAPAAFPHAFDLRQRAASFFHLRGVEPDGLAAVALMFGAGAALIFFADHCGMGAALGLIALGLGDLARVPAASVPAGCDRRARLMLPLVEPLMLAGLIAGIAKRHAPIVVLLACMVAVVHAWLPRLRSIVRERGLVVPSPLWDRTARLGIVLLGALGGRLGAALWLVVCVALLTAWRHVEQLEAWPAMGRVESWLRSRQLVDEHGCWTPMVRWTSLAVCAVALFLLPASSAWRF